MSIAVRVSVGILAALVLVSVLVAGGLYMQKQTVESQNQGLHNEITNDESKLADLTTQAKKLQDEADQLNSKIAQSQQQKQQVQSLYDELKQKSGDLQSQLDQANSDRDDWKNRVETMRHENEQLLQKLQNQPAKIVYKDRVVEKVVHDAAAATDNSAAPVDVASPQGDQYWASVLRDKAALQVELEREKYSLDQAALEVADLKKQNSDLQLAVSQANNEKDEIAQKIKYGQDLADNLSIDLARSRNDQKAVNDRAENLKHENLAMQSQVEELTANKVDLEKTISRLTDDKDAMQRKLIETESIIQSRIDDIWKIKESLDKRLSENSASSSGGSMELPPIVVNAPAQATSDNAASAAASAPAATAATPAGKTQGSIISINEPNNFVIVDLGQENSSVSVGNSLKAYRNGQEIADLEVIQVRRDICAADIKDKNVELQVGDVVKFN